MRTSEFVNLAYFLIFTLLAIAWPLHSHSRVKAILIGLSGTVLNGIAWQSHRWITADAAEIIGDWVPVPLMALAYWQSGCFFQKPNLRLQLLFDCWDRQILNIFHINSARWQSSWLGAFLELAYLLCYPVVPLGLAALYLAGMSNMADAYWTVVLVSAYPCYALLPFVQLMPPRLLEGSNESVIHTGQLRRFNIWLVRRITHEATTFPSGHVAASAAIALMLLRWIPAVGVVFLLIALGIAMGCFVGRYHYALDVGAALVLAGAVFAVAG